jgi:hypothetical protein
MDITSRLNTVLLAAKTREITIPPANLEGEI